MPVSVLSSPYICTAYIGLFNVVEGLPFEKEPFNQLTLCSVCIMPTCNFIYFPFLISRRGFWFCSYQFLIIAFFFYLYWNQ